MLALTLGYDANILSETQLLSNQVAGKIRFAIANQLAVTISFLTLGAVTVSQWKRGNST